LRDQRTTVELDTFQAVWQVIADALKTTVVTEFHDENTSLQSENMSLL
jgi:hypothetical protein